MGGLRWRCREGTPSPASPGVPGEGGVVSGDSGQQRQSGWRYTRQQARMTLGRPSRYATSQRPHGPASAMIHRLPLTFGLIVLTSLAGAPARAAADAPASPKATAFRKDVQPLLTK